MDVNLFEAQPVPSAIWPRELGDNLRAFATAVRAVLLDAELPRDVFVGWARASLTCSETTWRWRRRASFLPGCERALTADDWSELAASVPRVLDHLHGGADESKYESLRRNILAWDAEDSRIATLSADHAPTAIIGFLDMDNAVPGAVGSEAATVPVLGAVVEVSMMSGIERAQTK